jgi:hypothetical protein
MAEILTFRGRKLPLNDWEGDDQPGPWVTCMDTAAGRSMAWATNGRVDVDGKVIRAHVKPNDLDGISFEQVDKAVQAVNEHCRVVHPEGWNQSKVYTWLRAGRGLIVTGIYSTIPRQYRHQTSASFAHAMFVSHMSRSGKSIRLYDPLNPDLKGHGLSVPSDILWPFLASRGYLVGYVPLHKLHL